MSPITQIPKKVSVISVSGGMDSTALLLNQLTRSDFVHVVNINYGQKHSIEIEKLKKNLEYLKDCGFDITSHFIDLSSISSLLFSSLTTKGQEIPEGHYEEESMKSTVVPNRNAIFSSILFGYALSLYKAYSSDDNTDKYEVFISLGVHSGDHAIYPDCRPEFYEQIHKAFQEGNWDGDKVGLELPYLNYDKTKILQDALESCRELGISFDVVFHNTNTSYNPDQQGRASGTSGADIERIEAFLNIGRIDPCVYQKPWPLIVSDAKKKLGREY